MKCILYDVPLVLADHAIPGVVAYIHGAPDADSGINGSARELNEFVKRTAKMKTLVDVGAQVGLFSLLFTAMEGTVAYAYEPSPFAFQCLRYHCDMNPSHTIRASQTFIGGHGRQQVACGVDEMHVVANGGKTQHGEWVFTEHSLDGLLGAVVPVDCIKVDVEGYETQVLRGAKYLITKHRPMIFLEGHLNSLAENGESRGSLYRAVRDLGYCVKNLDGDSLDSFDDGTLVRVICTAE